MQAMPTIRGVSGRVRPTTRRQPYNEILICLTVCLRYVYLPPPLVLAFSAATPAPTHLWPIVEPTLPPTPGGTIGGPTSPPTPGGTIGGPTSPPTPGGTIGGPSGEVFVLRHVET